MLKRTLSAAALLAAFAAPQALAHPLWILPSHFTVSADEGDWITFDVTASHGTFTFDKPASADSARIERPDGEQDRPDHVFKGKRRSVFDYHFVEDGTYRIGVAFPEMYMTNFQAGRRDSVRRIPASKAERDALLPEGAREVVTTQMLRAAHTYVTVKAPDRTVLEPKGQGFEIIPLTHPADFIEQEEVSFQFLFNGEAVQGVEVNVTPEGTLYRNRQDAISAVSGDDGKISFTPEHAGRYLMDTSFTQELKDDPRADRYRAVVNVTFEVQLD
ncbi:DUF4198 domain-containing protein [Ferrimonas marina]|uniref:Uncharacterized conserved protein, contains GH25 family domain n=1 Tax=Ferrimonas marina TaxID=299255 RepID=A0A1M5VC22_9GAMM|nr:DUF4198 domain-containing protein [Ferrimonas marina]SHH72746.1 Uncharacterized conserved protein, contains GH25 family domain [Ferrimonas marina]